MARTDAVAAARRDAEYERRRADDAERRAEAWRRVAMEHLTAEEDAWPI